jgi:hypothetical protein
MAGELGEMIVRVGTDITDLTRGLADAENRVDAFGAGMQSAGLRIAAVGAAISGAFLAAASAVDDAQDRIRISTGATGAALGRLKADFDAVASSVPSSLGQIAQAVGELNARSGLAGPALQGLSAQVLNLSRLTDTDLGGNIRNSTRIFEDWNVATTEQGRTLDILFRTFQATGVGVDTLAQKVVQFGAPLRQLGFSFEQSAALLGKFEREGVNADQVLSGLRRSLGTFAKAGLDAPAGLRATIAEIERLGPGAQASALAMQVFGTRAGPDMAAAILEGRLSIESLLTQITASEETINRTAAQTADFGEQFVILKNQALIALNALAAPALPAFTALAERAIGIVEELGFWFASLSGGTRKTIVDLSILAVGMGTTMAAVGTLTRAIAALNAVMGITSILAATRAWLALIPAIRSTADAVYLLRAAWIGLQASMGPIGWITLAVTALAGLAYAFYKAGNSAEDAARRGKVAIDEFAGSIAALNRLQLSSQRVEIEAETDAIRARMKALEDSGRAFQSATPSFAAAKVGDGFATAPVRTKEFQSLAAELAIAEGKLGAVRNRFSELTEAEAEAAAAADSFRTSMGGTDADLSRIGKGAEDTSAALRNLTMAAAEFQRLQRIGLTSRESAPEGLQAQFAVVDELRGKIQALQDDLAKLGAAAPAGARALLEALTSALASAATTLDASVGRMEAALRTPQAVSTTLGASVTLPTAQRANAAQLINAANAMDALAKRTERAKDQAGALVDTLYEFSRVLGPLGEVGRALGGIAASIADAVSAARNVQNARAAGGSATEVLGAVLPLAGAIGGLIGGISALANRQSEGAQAIRDNERALRDLEMELRGFKLTIGVQGDIGKALDDFLSSSLVQAAQAIGGVFYTSASQVEASLKRFGLTLAEMDAAAARFGIQLYDSKGRVIIGAVEQLAEALRLSALSVTEFASTLEGQRKLMDARNQIFDVTDPATLLQGQIDFLQQIAPELLKQFGLSNLNLSTDAGRAALEGGLRDLIEALTKGAIDPAMLAGFESVDDFIAYLLDADRALDGFANAADKASESLTNAVEGFKIAAYRFQASEVAPERTAAPVGPATPHTQPTVPIQVAPVSIAAIHVYGVEGEGGLGTYREFRGAVVELAAAHPPLKAFADTLPEV